MALHVLFSLVQGIEAVHALGQYHGDVHSQNILIQPRGVRFDLKLVDFFDWGKPARYKQQQDVINTIEVFGECLGGRKHLRELPDEVRYICSALRQDVIKRRFPSMTHLRQHLEHFAWQTVL
jgi:RIO-like serine/threonine protein kinase